MMPMLNGHVSDGQERRVKGERKKAPENKVSGA